MMIVYYDATMVVVFLLNKYINYIPTNLMVKPEIVVITCTFIRSLRGLVNDEEENSWDYDSYHHRNKWSIECLYEIKYHFVTWWQVILRWKRSNFVEKKKKKQTVSSVFCSREGDCQLLLLLRCTYKKKNLRDLCNLIRFVILTKAFI